MAFFGECRFVFYPSLDRHTKKKNILTHCKRSAYTQPLTGPQVPQIEMRERGFSLLEMQDISNKMGSA